MNTFVHGRSRKGPFMCDEIEDIDVKIEDVEDMKGM